LSEEYKKGKKFTWWGFSSTTNEVEVLSSELFFGKHGKRTLFNLHTKLGCDINKYSVYQKESEILLPPGIRLEVISVLSQGDSQIVSLKELDGLNVQ